MLNINIWDIVWTVVNLLIFFILLRIFLFKPVMKVMDERKKKIQDDLDIAQAAREESEELKAQYEAELADVHEEADKIRSNAKKYAEKEKAEIIAGAHAQAENSVYHALKDGYRLIDTARYYQCEVGVGKGVRRAIDEGIVTREEVFITSKIMPSDYERASQGIDDSLADLGMDYVDLMLIHQPGSNDEAVYKAMEQAVRDGKVRSIGISNYYTPEAFDEVMSYAEITPAVIQNENHIYYQNTALQEYVKKYGVVVESWYPFGGRGHTSENFNNETITAIAQSHEKTSAQIILRWHLQAGFIAISGSSNPDHIAENYDIFDFELSNTEMQQIMAINQNRRYENW